jgi:tetratricopeptide (TPR) repeat protein
MKKYIVAGLIFLLIPPYVFAQTFDELLIKGDQFYTDANYVEAEKYFSQAIGADAKNPKGFWYRGDAREQLKNHDGAIVDYSKAIELGLLSDKIYKGRGDSYYNKQLYTLAEKDYSKAIELAPTRAILWYDRADCYKFMQQLDKACADYQKASELGDTYAKPEAASLKCAWAKSVPKPCTTDLPKIEKIEVEPFTGLVTVSKGIFYSEILIKPKEGVGYITAAEFGADVAFSIKVMAPKNFCEEANGNVFPAMGFQFFDNNGKLLGGMDDLYQSYTDGFPGEELSFLSLKLSFDKTDTVMREGREYLLKIRMFDKKGNKELLMELPFKRTEKTQITNNVEYSKSVIGPGINSSSVNASVKRIELIKNGKAELFSNLQSNQNYSISLSELNNLNGKLSYQLKFVDMNGTSSKIKEGTTTGGASTKVDLSTAKLNSGDYILWLKLNDAGGNSFGVTIPVKIN